MVDCPCDDIDERDCRPPRGECVGSAEVFIEEKPEMLLTEEGQGAPASEGTVDPWVVLKGRLELYML